MKQKIFSFTLVLFVIMSVQMFAQNTVGINVQNGMKSVVEITYNTAIATAFPEISQKQPAEWAAYDAMFKKKIAEGAYPPAISTMSAEVIDVQQVPNGIMFVSSAEAGKYKTQCSVVDDTFYLYRQSKPSVAEFGKNISLINFMGVVSYPLTMKTDDELQTVIDQMFFPKASKEWKDKVKVKTKTETTIYSDSDGRPKYAMATDYYKEVLVANKLTVSTVVTTVTSRKCIGEEQITIGDKTYTAKKIAVRIEITPNTTITKDYGSFITGLTAKIIENRAKKSIANIADINTSEGFEWFIPELCSVVKIEMFDIFGNPTWSVKAVSIQ